MQVFTKKKIKDFSVYGIGQAINLLSPLVVMPYLIYICGEDGLGKIGVGFSVALIINSFIDYGSYITGVKEISLNRENTLYIIQKAKAIYFSKLLLLLFVVILFTGLFLFVPYFAKEKTLFFLSLSIVLGQFFNPAWFFQATENYKWISIINILSKIIYVACVFIFIRHKEDYILANLFFGLGAVIAGITGIVYLMSKYSVRFSGFSLQSAVEILKREFTFSISQVFLSVYQFIPIIIISYVLGDYVAGQFRVIDQIVMMIKSYLNIFFYFVFANICYELNKSLKKGLSVWKQYNISNFIFVAVIVAVFFLGAEILLQYFKLEPENIKQVAFYFRVGLIIPLLIAISLPLRQLMFAFEKNRIYIALTIGTTVLHIIVLWFATALYGLLGSFVSIILIEFIVIVLYLLILKNHLKSLKAHDSKAL